MNSFVTKEVSIYYPFPDEFPHALLESGGVGAERLRNLESEPFIRVAKVSDEVVGAYLLTQQDDPQRFRLEGLAVEEGFRGRGLGSWLVGHAIGVAESKGGRHVITARAYAGELFARLGFAAEGERWHLEITPE